MQKRQSHLQIVVNILECFFLFFHSGKVFENNLQELICSLQTFYSMHHDSLKGISQCHVSDPYNPPKVWFQSRS